MIACPSCRASTAADGRFCSSCGSTLQSGSPAPSPAPVARRVAATSAEQTLYGDPAVLVSTTRLIVNGVTYPLANVSSVRFIVEPPNRTPVIVLILVGLLFLIGGLNTLIVTVILVGIGILVGFLQKSRYVLLIGSAGGEKSALSGHDQAYMANVVEHINRAIIERG